MKIFGLALFVAMATLFSVALSQESNDTESVTPPNNATLDNPRVSVLDARTLAHVKAKAKPVTKRRLSKRGGVGESLEKLRNVFSRPASLPKLPGKPDVVVDLQWEKGLYVTTISLSTRHLPFKVVVDTGATDTSFVLDWRTYPHLRTSEMVEVTDIVGFSHTSGREPYFEVKHDFQPVQTLVVDSSQVGTGIQGILSMSPGRDSFLTTARKERPFTYVMLLALNSDNPQLHMGSCNVKDFGKMEWHQVVNPIGWIIADGRINVINADLRLPVATALIDSGTPYIYGPASDVEKIYTALRVPLGENSNTYRIPCRQGYKMTVGFGWGKETWEIDIAKGCTAGTAFQKDCVGAIQPHDIKPGQPEWRLGTEFMEHFYTMVFRYEGSDDTKFVGFIERKP